MIVKVRAIYKLLRNLLIYKTRSAIYKLRKFTNCAYNITTQYIYVNIIIDMLKSDTSLLITTLQIPKYKDHTKLPQWSY